MGTGIDPETVAFGALGIGALHLWIMGTCLGDRALGVVDDQALRHRAEPLEGAPMAAEPGAYALVPHELDVLMAREAQRHHEGPRAAQLSGGRIDELRTGAEIDLCRICRRERQRTVASGGRSRSMPAMSRRTLE